MKEETEKAEKATINKNSLTIDDLSNLGYDLNQDANEERKKHNKNWILQIPELIGSQLPNKPKGNINLNEDSFLTIQYDDFESFWKDVRQASHESKSRPINNQNGVLSKYERQGKAAICQIGDEKQNICAINVVDKDGLVATTFVGKQKLENARNNFYKEWIQEDNNNEITTLDQQKRFDIAFLEDQKNKQKFVHFPIPENNGTSEVDDTISNKDKIDKIKDTIHFKKLEKEFRKHNNYYLYKGSKYKKDVDIIAKLCQDEYKINDNGDIGLHETKLENHTPIYNALFTTDNWQEEHEDPSKCNILHVSLNGGLYRKIFQGRGEFEDTPEGQKFMKPGELYMSDKLFEKQGEKYVVINKSQIPDYQIKAAENSVINAVCYSSNKENKLTSRIIKLPNRKAIQVTTIEKNGKYYTIPTEDLLEARNDGKEGEFINKHIKNKDPDVPNGEIENNITPKRRTSNADTDLSARLRRTSSADTEYKNSNTRRASNAGTDQENFSRRASIASTDSHERPSRRASDAGYDTEGTAGRFIRSNSVYSTSSSMSSLSSASTTSSVSSMGGVETPSPSPRTIRAAIASLQPSKRGHSK